MRRRALCARFAALRESLSSTTERLALVSRSAMRPSSPGIGLVGATSVIGFAFFGLVFAFVLRAFSALAVSATLRAPFALPFLPDFGVGEISGRVSVAVGGTAVLAPFGSASSAAGFAGAGVRPSVAAGVTSFLDFFGFSAFALPAFVLARAFCFFLAGFSLGWASASVSA